MKNILCFIQNLVFATLFLFSNATHAASQKTIQDYWQALPTTAFDDTTEGLSEAEKLQLLQKQNSASWQSQKVSDKKMVVTCKIPNSVVTLRVKMLEEEVLEVKTQNEQVLKFQYFAFGADGKLTQVYPKVWVMAANEVWQDQDQVNLTLLPEDLKQWIEAQTACHHWQGEDAYDAERAKMIQEAIAKLGCDTLPRKETNLRKAYNAKLQLLQILDQAKTMIGE